MGAQKNRLHETVLLSTQNKRIMSNEKLVRYSTFDIQMEKLVRYDIRYSIFKWRSYFDIRHSIFDIQMEKLVRYSTFDIRYSNGEVSSIFDIRYSIFQWRS